MIQERTPSFSLMQAVKRRFFAMRNGDLAAQMAKGGITYRINFGLNLPQISDIARAALSGALPDNSHVPDDDERRALARLLWENTTTRESRLIAPMLLTPADLDADGALAMLAGTGTTEEADVLCHKLLRNHPDAAKIAAALATAPESTDIQRYAALRLMMNLLACGKADISATGAAASAESSRVCRLTAPLCRQITTEIDFLTENKFFNRG